MKLTTQNINDYFSLDTKVFENGASLPNILIRPKGFPPINTPFTLEEYNSMFGDPKFVGLSVTESGVVCITDGVTSTPIGLTTEALEPFVKDI